MNPIDWQKMFQPELHPLDTVLRATLVFFGAQVCLRIAGRREFARSTVWDIVALLLVTTALRKTLVAEDNSVTSGLLALLTLAVWDRGLSRLTYHVPALARLIDGPVVELVRDGQVVEKGARRTNLTRDELLSRLREKGTEDLGRVRRAFMEPDGKVTFLMKD